MYNLCVFTCIILIFVFYCTHVQVSYVLNSYLLIYLLNQLQCNRQIHINCEPEKTSPFFFFKYDKNILDCDIGVITKHDFSFYKVV